MTILISLLDGIDHNCLCRFIVKRMRQYIAYYRVSTAKQGVSGLGLEGQEYSVKGFVGTQGDIIASFTEVESGKNNSRIQLEKALALAMSSKATLLIAKLDRLSRNASFIMMLRDSGIDFVACDMPQANTLTIGIMALMAQQEREQISSRTKAAIQAKKARGEKVGNPNNFSHTGRMAGGAAIKAKSASNMNNRLASEFAKALRSQKLGLAEIASRLMAGGFQSAKGKGFHPATVSRLLT